MSNTSTQIVQKFRKKVSQKLKGGNFTFHRIWILISTKRGRKRIFNFFEKAFKYLMFTIFGIKIAGNRDYRQWVAINIPDEKKLKLYLEEQNKFEYIPLISIILPVYNPPIHYLKAAIESVAQQIYQNWELCISDDCSPNKEVAELLNYYSMNDTRIKVIYRKENGHISLNSNSALELAKGEYVALLDHDDLLTADALFQNVKLLNLNRNIDFIYSDEDKVDDHGQYSEPHFKPDWCPENFMSRNYICHFSVIKRALVNEVGGFRKGYEGSQDFDLFLRISEKTERIFHIPKVLYHWRKHEASTSNEGQAKPYAYIAGKKALEDALSRRNIKGTVSAVKNMTGYYHIDYEIFDPGKVSIIIPSKNKHELCNTAIESIVNMSSYKEYEIILVNNNSDEEGFFKMVDYWKDKLRAQFICIDDNEKFNFSRLINNGAKAASGKYLLLLNNDTKVIDADWIQGMISQVQFDHIGAAGAKLLYPNNLIQHAGVVIGMGGIAEHVFAGTDSDENGYFNYLNCINNFSAVTAACLMVKAKSFNDLNGFDESFPVEYNDIDFCLRLVEKGYRNVYLPFVALYHYESISRGHPHSSKDSYQIHLNDVNRFKTKWQKYIDHDPCYNPNLSLVYNDFRLRLND